MRTKAKSKSKEYWQRLNEEYEASERTIRAFCQERGVNRGTFKWWRKNFKRSAISTPEAPMFREVAMPQRLEAAYTLILRGGRELKLSSAFLAAEVKELIGILESC